MPLQRQRIPLKNKVGRVFMQRNPDNPYFLLENHGLNSANDPAPPLVAIWAQSMVERAGSVLIDISTGDQEMPSFTIPSYVFESANVLLDIKGEPVNVQLMSDTQGQPTQYGSTRFGFAWLLARRGPATMPLGSIPDNAGEGGPMVLEAPFNAIIGPIPLDFSMALATKTPDASQDQVGRDVFALPVLKDEDSAKRVLPGQIGMVVSDSAVAPAYAPISYTTDWFGTFTACAGYPFSQGVGAISVVGFGDGLNPRFIVSAETQAGAAPGISYTDDWGATWTAGTITGGGTNADEMSRLWIIHAGHIYGVGGQAGSSKIWYSKDGGANWAESDPGLSQPLRDIEVMGNGVGYACGDSNTVARVEGHTNWTTLTGPAAGAGDANLAIAVQPTHGAVWMGNDAGELYRSRDKGANWTAVTANIQGYTATSINHIGFDPMAGDFGFMEITTATPARVKLRTMDGGVTWKAYSLGAPAGANIASNGMHVVGPNHVLFVGALYNSLASVLLGQSLFDGSRVT